MFAGAVNVWIQLQVMGMLVMMMLATNEAKQVTAEVCTGNGVTPFDQFSIIVCIHGYGYIQPCPQGTRNSDTVMRGVKDEYESVCDENLVGEKGVKVRYPSPSQFKLLNRRRTYSYPGGRREYYQQQKVHGREGYGKSLKSGGRVFEEPSGRHLSVVKSQANTLASDTVTPSQPHAAPLSPAPEPTKPVVIEGPPEARRRFLQSAADLHYVPQDLQPRQAPSAGERSVLYGIPRVTQVYGALPTTTSPQIDPLNNHSKSAKEHKNYHKYFMQQIRQFGSSESSSREDDGKIASQDSGTLSSFASLFHNGQPMGYFSITQSNGNQYPSIDFYPLERYRNTKLPLS